MNNRDIELLHIPRRMVVEGWVEGKLVCTESCKWVTKEAAEDKARRKLIEHLAGRLK